MSIVEEWKTVTRSDKKRVMRRRGGRGHSSSTTRANGPIRGRNVASSTSLLIEDRTVLEHVVECCMVDLKRTSLYQKLLLLLNDSSLLPRHLVCYGIGNFSASSTEHYSASMWQMACALCLQAHLLNTDNDENGTKDEAHLVVSYFDPCILPFEERFLAERGVRLLTTNDRGKLVLAGDEVPVVFFMPHCPKRLYENLVWAHWSSLERIVIVGNSLVRHAEALSNEKHSCPCLESLLPWIKENKLESSKQDFKDAAGNLVGAFNDTYFTTFMRIGYDDTRPDRPESRDFVDDDKELL